MDAATEATGQEPTETGQEPTGQELAIRQKVLDRHPRWTVERVQMTAAGSLWWEIRDAHGTLIARQRDIVLAAEVATGRRL